MLYAGKICLTNRIPINIILELGKNFYFKVLSAVDSILRDFTQDNLNLFISFIFDNSVTYSYGHLSGELSPKTLQFAEQLSNNKNRYAL